MNIDYQLNKCATTIQNRIDKYTSVRTHNNPKGKERDVSYRTV